MAKYKFDALKVRVKARENGTPLPEWTRDLNDNDLEAYLLACELDLFGPPTTAVPIFGEISENVLCRSAPEDLAKMYLCIGIRYCELASAVGDRRSARRKPETGFKPFLVVAEKLNKMAIEDGYVITRDGRIVPAADRKRR